MNVAYINPFLCAIQDVFDTMIDVPFSLGQPYLKKRDRATYQVNGVIHMSGEVVGSIVFSFPASIAIALASALLGEEVVSVDDMCSDAIGEIANIIAGNAKTYFPNGRTTISIPTVVIGRQRVAYPVGVPIISIPCNTEIAPFSVDVALTAS